MVSVAMASYNGEKYIKEQLISVLDNLSENDEVVISDDGSTDRTVEIIKEINDKRIKLISGPCRGLVKNFENAVKSCTGDYIFLCDQDDIWYKDKVKKVCKFFEENDCDLVEHDAVVTNGKGDVIYPSFFKYRRVRCGYIKNMIRNTYHGCLMAFKSELKTKIFPFPNSGCLHDQWIGILADYYGKVCFLNEILMEYKRHESNASSFKHLPFSRQLCDRLILIKNFSGNILKARKLH